MHYEKRLMAITAGCGFGLLLEHVALVALLNEGFGCMFVLNFHAKMHLRFGSKAVDTGSYGGDIKCKYRHWAEGE